MKSSHPFSFYRGHFGFCIQLIVFLVFNESSCLSCGSPATHVLRKMSAIIPLRVWSRDYYMSTSYEFRMLTSAGKVRFFLKCKNKSNHQAKRRTMRYWWTASANSWFAMESKNICQELRKSRSRRSKIGK